MKLFAVLGPLAWLTGIAVADTILENGAAPTFSTMPFESGVGVFTGANTGTPYWDNFSTDLGGSGNVCGGNCGNVGDFLTATGSFTGGTNFHPNQYLSGSGSGAGANNAPAAFNLVRNSNSLLITLLGSNTVGSDSFGIYDASKNTTFTAAATEIPLLTTSTGIGTTVNESGISFTNYGFYVTNSGGTWFSNTALDLNDGTHQHFALFTLASDANVFYLGVTDWFFGNGGEGNGDYQDLLIRINSDAVPEPDTFALMGASLLGLGYARFRARGKRA